MLPAWPHRPRRPTHAPHPLPTPFPATYLVPAVVLLVTMSLAACSGPPAEAPEGAAQTAEPGLPGWLAQVMDEDGAGSFQAVSLLGDDLLAMDPVEASTAEAIAAADTALRADPANVDLLVEAGRVRRNAWQYRQEMAFYTRAMELDPDDWRPWRFRGHRFLSVREFDDGIRDLERARELAPRDWDVAYHLGLAYFLAGRFGEAADAYLSCLRPAAEANPSEVEEGLPESRSCSANETDPESRVAMTEWAVRALLRADRGAEAEALYRALPPGLEVGTNVAYHHNLLLYRGEKTEAELLDIRPDGPYRLGTVGFGIANRRLAQGDTAGAERLLEELVADPWWPGFGRIAAEVELARLRR
jgi:tetratricopeptide (TPR) repeat protein